MTKLLLLSRHISVFAVAVCLGLLTAWLLPAILLAWLDVQWRRDEFGVLLDAARPHVCDGDLIASETNDAWIDDIQERITRC